MASGEPTTIPTHDDRIRREALEEAARACEMRARAWQDDPWERAGAYRNEAECCAAAIRALAEKEPGT